MDHAGWLSLGPRAHFHNFYRESGSENRTLQPGTFVVVTPFSCFSSKDSHQFRLKRNVFSSFLQKLLLFPKEYYTF